MQTIYQTHVHTGVSRTAFLSKVFAFFGLALLISLLGVVLGGQLILAYPSIFANSFMFYGVFALELLLIFTARAWSQIRGLNYLLFALFAAFSGFTAVPLLWAASAVGGIPLLVKALGATVTLFGGIAIYGAVTRRDLSGMGGFLFVGLIGVIIASLVNFFVQSSAFDYFLSWVVVLVFSGFTMYDIQMIKTRYPDNMFLEAALALYLDFFNLFINILNIMSAGRR